MLDPSHPGKALKDYLGDMTVKEAARRLGVTRANLSRILNGRAGIFSGDERTACQGDAVHVSGVLAEAAAELRPLEGSENQAAENQTVFGTAAEGGGLGLTLESLPRTGSTSIVYLVARSAGIAESGV